MVNVIGLGYIGLPTALMMATHGVEVVGTARNVQRIADLNAGKAVFKEEGLSDLLCDALRTGIRFTTEYQVADTYIITVQTPYDDVTKKVDMTFVNNAIGDVLPKAPKGATIVIESTISPGAIDTYVRPFIEKEGYVIGEDVYLAHAPERIIPGNMMYELVHNDRTIGVDNPEIGEKIKKFYSSFCQGDIVVTSIKTAEMTKVVENTFRCVNIAFANELSKICRRENMDVYEVISICNRHPRVNILQPGPGVGGHCIPIDPWFLVGDYPEIANIIRESLLVNQSMPDFVLERAKAVMSENGIKDLSRVGVYGMTFKENVDDMRDSPTLQLIERHPSEAAQMKFYDPFIDKEIVKSQYHDLDSFLADIDMVIIMVGHNELRDNAIKLHNKIVLDTRKSYDGPNVYRL